MHAVLGSGRLIAGRYLLQSPIGRGAMGIVWRSRDELLQRVVAVKEVQITALASPADAEVIYQRTLREARTAARLSHPGVAAVFDVVEEGGTPWIVMELVPARSLDQVIAEDGPLPPLEAGRLGTGLLSALSSAHAAGVLHRDVKPSNVLMTAEGRAVLTDFGIATFAGDPGLTQAGMVLGTPGFTAPERMRGRPATPASDLWSLGATLYAAVEGRGPFDRLGSKAVIGDHLTGPEAPRAPSAGPLGPVIDALLLADPERRPDSRQAARLLADAVARATAERPTVASGAATSRPGTSNTAAGDTVTGGDGVDADTDALAGDQGAQAAADDGLPEFMATPAFAELTMPVVPASADDLRGAALADGPALADGAALAGSAALASDGLASADGAASAGPEAAPDGARPGPGTPAVRPARRSRPVRRLVAVAGALAFLGLGITGWSVFSQTLVSTPAQSAPATSHRTTARVVSRRHGAGARPGRGLPGIAGGEPAAGASGGSGPAGHGKASGAGRATGAGKAAGTAKSGTGSKGNGGTPGPAPAPSPSPSSSPTSPAPSPPPRDPPPAGYRWVKATAASLGSTAGFEIAVPAAWQRTADGPATYLRPPAGSSYIEVSVAPFARPNPVREAKYLQAQAVAAAAYPGYHRIAITPGYFRNAAEGRWRFWWRQPGIGRTGVLELLFTLQTTVGPQAYTLTISAPGASFPARYAVFQTAVATFRPLP